MFKLLFTRQVWVTSRVAEASAFLLIIHLVVQRRPCIFLELTGERSNALQDEQLTVSTQGNAMCHDAPGARAKINTGVMANAPSRTTQKHPGAINTMTRSVCVCSGHSLLILHKTVHWLCTEEQNCCEMDLILSFNFGYFQKKVKEGSSKPSHWSHPSVSQQ